MNVWDKVRDEVCFAEFWTGVYSEDIFDRIRKESRNTLVTLSRTLSIARH